jgi:hypothetical protein
MLMCDLDEGDDSCYSRQAEFKHVQQSPEKLHIKNIGHSRIAGSMINRPAVLRTCVRKLLQTK